ncbi:MAG: YicC family protein [Muribaculaceae bacterium]|nr:YicC family protein [Muribaculaceae bacterium]
MLYSMTGYGSHITETPTRKITADVKSLNSKQLDLTCRMPFGCRSIEPELRSLVSSIAERGKIDLIINIERTDFRTSSRINPDVFAAYKDQLTEVARIVGIPAPEDWYATILRLPDVVTATDEFDQSEQTTNTLLVDVMNTAKSALKALMDYRRSEGLRLEEFFSLRIERIRELLSQVDKYETERVEKIRERLTDSLSKIPAVDYDKNRLEQEMIYYIEKLDVNEEKQRLRQHLDYFIETMNQPKGGQGKKLGFIAQEMTREINTLGSKSNHAEMQNIVVRMKDELEQIKEQVLNVM